MDRQLDGLAGAMREIAEQRDTQLRDAGAISPERFVELQTFLAAESPVEAALIAAARRRDASLTSPEPGLPSLVHVALMEQVRGTRTSRKPIDTLRPLFARTYRAAAVAALAVATTYAVLYFSRSSQPSPLESRRVSIVNPAPVAFSDADVFERSAEQLTLRVSRTELASLDTSLLTIRRALPGFEQSDRGLLLDLPIRQIRLDVDAVRTP